MSRNHPIIIPSTHHNQQSYNLTNTPTSQQTQQRILRSLPRSSRQEPEVLTAEWRRQTDVYRLLRVSPTQPRSTLFKSHQARTDGLRRSAYKECKKNWVSHRSRSPDTINGLLCRARVLTRRAADGGNERRKAQKRQTLVLSSFRPLFLRRRQSPMYPLGKHHPTSELVRYVYWEVFIY